MGEFKHALSDKFQANGYWWLPGDAPCPSGRREKPVGYNRNAPAWSRTVWSSSR